MTDPGLPIEDFIQAITSQLDRTQEALALKAQAGLPLTFAVKDLSLDLRAHLDMQGAVVRIRPAGPGDSDASLVHLELATITRPMIEENTRPQAAAAETSLREALGDDLTDEDERRMEWAGIRSVEQLRALREQQGDAALGRTTHLPVQRLASRLLAASRPEIHDIREEVDDQDGHTRLRIDGRHLRGATGNGALAPLRDPRVRLRGMPLEVLEASDDQIVASLAGALGGVLEVATGAGTAAVATSPPRPDDAAPAVSGGDGQGMEEGP